MNRQNLLNKITDTDEKMALAKVLDKVDLCLKARINTFSEFLDPAKTTKFLNMLSSGNCKYKITAFGGRTDSERKLLGFSIAYEPIEESCFPIKVVEINYNHKFSKGLTHRDFLGSIMGLGIDRGKIGDIIPQEGGALAFLTEELADYVSVNLEKVGSIKVRVNQKQISDISLEEISEAATSKRRLTVASLRVDNVISAEFRLSRSKSAGLIEGEKVFVNWLEVSNCAKQVKEGDVITVRGVGRVRLCEIGKTTKKDRISIYVQ